MLVEQSWLVFDRQYQGDVALQEKGCVPLVVKFHVSFHFWLFENFDVIEINDYQ